MTHIIQDMVAASQKLLRRKYIGGSLTLILPWAAAVAVMTGTIGTLSALGCSFELIKDAATVTGVGAIAGTIYGCVALQAPLAGNAAQTSDVLDDQKCNEENLAQLPRLRTLNHNPWRRSSSWHLTPRPHHDGGSVSPALG